MAHPWKLSGLGVHYGAAHTYGHQAQKKWEASAAGGGYADIVRIEGEA